MIAALFVADDGAYVGRDGIEAWTKDRDARTYAGPHPIVGHPPCERWGNFSEGGPTAKRPFKTGDDDGCFASALASVRRFGGVLEHPRGSKAWAHFGLPIPKGKGWTPADEHGGRSCYIDQGAYGHPAKKPTWLYAVLPAYPEMRWERVWGRPRIGGGGYRSTLERARAKARVSGFKPVAAVPERWRYLTPDDLRAALVSMAESCRGWTPEPARARQVALPGVSALG